MKITVKPSFDKDVERTRSRELLLALDEKIEQITRANNPEQITGLKLLRG